MSEKMFVYGTLQDPEIQMKILGKVLRSVSGSLAGFRKSMIISDKNSYPIIEADASAKEEIKGLVLDIDEKDLIQLDAYEGEAYIRKRVMLKNGILAWAYQKDPRS